MRKTLAAALLLGVIASTGGAFDFHPIGVAALSMGGAGVACSRGSFAAYYNPGLLGEQEYSCEATMFSLGIGFREINLVDAIDRLAKIDIDASLDEFGDNPVPGDPVPAALQSDIRAIQRELRNLSGKNGLQLMPNINVGVQAWRIGFGVYTISEISAYGIIDPARLEFIVETGGVYHSLDLATGTYGLSDQATYEARSLSFALNNNLTYVQVLGLAYAEIPIAYAHPIPTPIGTINVGAAAKIMPGYTFDLRVDIDTAYDDLLDIVEDASTDATSWGVDVGLLYRPADWWVSIGVVGKNLNTPAFDTATDGTIKVDPQVRAGVALELWRRRITCAADVDVTVNETLIPGRDAQYLGGGVNLAPVSWFSLRAGVMTNLAGSDEGIVYTAGLALGLKWVHLDISGQYSEKQSEFEGNQIPRFARAQVALVSRWH